MKMPSSTSVNGHLLNRAVLVLNANYSPMTICTAKRAICMNYLEKIDVLAFYHEKVHSPSIAVNLPSVVKIRNFIRYDNLSMELNRKNILARDKNTCQYCGKSNTPLTLDHILPKVKGGQDIWENLVTACKVCNQKKGDSSPEEAGMYLIKSPKRPHRIHFFQHYVRDRQEDWRPYLFMEPF